MILRLGHRIPRDQRVSTHLALAARALGAESMYYSGMRDPELEEAIDKVNRLWGGSFKLIYVDDPFRLIEELKSDGYKIVHLTMYGVNINNIIDELLKIDKFLVIVGGEKVPKEFFYISNFNVSIGTQPHSEISALAIFLDRIFQGAELDKIFSQSMYKIVEVKKGKKVVDISSLKESNLL